MRVPRRQVALSALLTGLLLAGLFGASAPGNVVMEKFGFTVDNVVARTVVLLGR